MPKILVAFATKSGSTAETARAIADELSAQGLVPEVRDMHEARSLAPFSGVVIVAPLYMLRLHKDARHFLAKHRTALGSLPVVLFVPGPVEKKDKDWVGARQQLDKELARFAWLEPAAAHIIGGKFDPAGLKAPWRWLPALRKLPANDARDWGAIRSLARDAAPLLQ